MTAKRELRPLSPRPPAGGGGVTPNAQRVGVTPNVADFGIVAFTHGLRLMCPECGGWVNLENNPVWPEIRDLINAASEHARLSHPIATMAR